MSARVKYQQGSEKTLSSKEDPIKLCSCKCHFGGAVSCPGCKNNHGITCCHCND